MAQLKDTTVTGDLSVSGNQTVTGNIAVSGTVDGRDVSVDGTKLDTLYPTIYRVQHDVAKTIMDITLIPQSSTPRFRWIRSTLSTVIECNYSYIPVSINITYYDTSGELQSKEFHKGNSVGVQGSFQNLEIYADLSYGPIKITTAGTEDDTTTHGYLLTVEIL
jgi:hypothetical protein